MAIPVLLILAVLWAAFFVWPLVQGRHGGRRRDSVSSFGQNLQVIGRTNGFKARRQPAAPPVISSIGSSLHAPIGPPRPSRPAPRSGSGMTLAQRRRRDVLVCLAILVVCTLVIALVGGVTMYWALQLAADVLLITYVLLLVRMRRAAAERRAKVHYLPQPVQPPVFALRRTASS